MKYTLLENYTAAALKKFKYQINNEQLKGRRGAINMQGRKTRAGMTAGRADRSNGKLSK